MPKSKQLVDTSSDSDSDVEPRKKKKLGDKAKEVIPKAGSSTMTEDGQIMFQLSKMRFASVSEFRGKKFVNIREYYDKDGEMKPGKKGIALNVEQWQKLKTCVAKIDEALDEL